MPKTYRLLAGKAVIPAWGILTSEISLLQSKCDLNFHIVQIHLTSFRFH